MDTVTRVLAAWGAVVSTIAIIWNIRRDLADRGKLRVVCYIGQVVGGLGPEDSQPKLVYNVTNTGRHPILVTHIGGAFSKDRHFMVPTRGPMPRTLQPGEYLLEYSEDLSVLHQKPEALWAIDSIGKYWKIPRRRVRQLIRECQKESTPPVS
jgi:hypothetical protein